MVRVWIADPGRLSLPLGVAGDGCVDDYMVLVFLEEILVRGGRAAD